jgi:hypothetical protein
VITEPVFEFAEVLLLGFDDIDRSEPRRCGAQKFLVVVVGCLHLFRGPTKEQFHVTGKWDWEIQRLSEKGTE